jgi:hypothetical protein
MTPIEVVHQSEAIANGHAEQVMKPMSETTDSTPPQLERRPASNKRSQQERRGCREAVHGLRVALIRVGLLSEWWNQQAAGRTSPLGCECHSSLGPKDGWQHWLTSREVTPSPFDLPGSLFLQAEHRYFRKMMNSQVISKSSAPKIKGWC